MKLLVIHQAFASPDSAGGTRHFELAQHLVRSGHEVTIVASDVNYLTGVRQSDDGIREENIDGVRVVRARTLPMLHRSFVWRIASFLSFMGSSILASLKAGRPDLVMGTSPPIFQGVSAWLVSLIRRKPFLLEIRDLWPEFAIDMGVLRNKTLIAWSRRLEGFLYSRADHLLVNSPAYREYLLEKNLPPHKISLVANGADPEAFDPNATGTPFRSKWAPGAQFVVTYAGALGLANDISTLIETAALLRDTGVKILIVGDGKERINLERQAKERELENVSFVGTVSKTEMPEVLAASDAGLAILKNIPMFTTTYPNKVFDYMAAGRPVILAIDGVIRQVVEDSGAGIFVRPGDALALSAAIQHLAALPDHGQTMGMAGRRVVEERFNRRKQAGEFQLLLERLVER